MGEKGQLSHSYPKWGGSDIRPSALQVKTSIPHHFCSDRFQCLSRLQGGGYVALGGISFGLKRRWQPRLMEAPSPRALRQGAPGGGGKRTRALPRDPGGGQLLGQLARGRRGATPASGPQLLGPPPPKPPPGLEGQRHSGDQTGLLRQRRPRADATLCGPLTRLRGPSITSIDPGIRGGRRKGSDGAEAHGGQQGSPKQLRRQEPLSAPREPAEGADGVITPPLPAPAPRAHPLRHGHARVMSSHAAGSRWE